MNNQAPSPASSLASDTDAYNTADARIHFGPLRSPEKRFHSVVACSNLHPSPSRSSPRRSPRISNPCPLSPHVTVGESSSTRYEHNHVNVNEETERTEEVVDPLHPETPEYEQFLQDEPPSVLATKIMRAHDNPSPPPDSPRSGFPDPDCRRHITSPRSPLSLPGHAMAVEQGLNLPLVDPSPLSPSSREVEHALLFFDSPLTTPTPSPSVGSPRASSPQPLVITSRPSVDDLLSVSPGPGHPSACLIPPCSSMPGHEQLKVDETLREQQEATCETTSLIGDVTLSSEGPSMCLQRLSSSLVPLGDDDSTEPHTAPHGTTVEDHRASSCTKAGSPPRIQKEHEKGTQTCLALDDRANESEGKEGHITRQNARDTRSASRELESLSPSSTDLLARLLPSPESEFVPVLDVARDNLRGVSAAVEQTDSLPSAQPSSRFPQLSVAPTPNTPIRLTSPIRFSSPTRSRGQQSPARSRIHPAALDDPQRTPARRIPIAQGYGSPQKEANLVGRVPVLNIPPTDSPARRVNVNEFPAPRQRSRFGSPAQDASSVKRLPADSQPSRMSSGKNKDAQRSHTISDPSMKSRIAGSSSASAMLKPHPLPFPIIASRAIHSQPTLEPKSTKGDATDVRMSSPVKSDSPPISSPARSSLKQTTSRIPRGIKPYARPAVHANRQDKSTPTIIGLVKTRVTPKALTKPGTSSDNAIPNSEPISTMPGKSTSTSMLKRKRGVEKASPPSKARPIVLLRQVPRVVPSSDAPKVSNVSSGVVREPIRRVQEVQSTRPMQQDSDSDPLETPDVEAQDNTTTLKFPSRMTSPSPLEQPAQDATDPPTRRRMTRIRKPAIPTAIADVFTDPTPPQARRRVSKAQSSGDGVLTGMSAVAVKALTSLNTLRNQQYLAAKIETEVVRKPGSRPESPAVKIKPTLQRRLEAKGKERKERADRRAKRNSGGIGESQSDVDRQSDTSDSSAADFDSDWDDQNSSPLRKRHKRGPGDEEDYETPLRPMGGEEDKAEATYEKRRVKWDRGLFTTIYLDEVTVGARRPPKDDTAPKGCLATTAKSAPLDTLGNLTNADTPLTELVRESVVVKKFVYDNDLEPVQEVVVVRNTRLRSKKGKD